MSTTHTIISQIFRDIVLSQNESRMIEDKMERIELKKGSSLLQAQDTVFHQYYVDHGCLRTYFIDSAGKEHTIQFAINDWWISDYTAFFNTGKAIMNIETIQDTTFYKISRSNMDALLLAIPQLETFFRKKMEGAFASFQKRILASLSQTAKERYLSFITTYPNIEQSVKNYHIASFLGITTESLSRIRKEIAQNSVS